jgi:hypothetical protein
MGEVWSLSAPARKEGKIFYPSQTQGFPAFPLGGIIPPLRGFFGWQVRFAPIPDQRRPVPGYLPH